MRRIGSATPMTTSQVLELPMSTDRCKVRLSSESVGALYFQLDCVGKNVLSDGGGGFKELDAAPHMCRIKLYFDVQGIIPFDDKSKSFFNTEEEHGSHFFKRLTCYVNREDLLIIASSMFRDMEAMVKPNFNAGAFSTYMVSHFTVGEKFHVFNKGAVPDADELAMFGDYVTRLDTYFKGAREEFRKYDPEICTKGYPSQESLYAMMNRANRRQPFAIELWAECWEILDNLEVMASAALSPTTALPFDWKLHLDDMDGFVSVFGDSCESLSVGYPAMRDILEEMDPLDNKDYIETFAKLLTQPRFEGDKRLVADPHELIGWLSKQGAKDKDIEKCEKMMKVFHTHYLTDRSSLVDLSEGNLVEGTGFHALESYGVIFKVRDVHDLGPVARGSYGLVDYWGSIRDLEELVADGECSLTIVRHKDLAGVVEEYRTHRIMYSPVSRDFEDIKKAQHFTPHNIFYNAEMDQGNKDFLSPNKKDGSFTIRDDTEVVYLYFGQVFEVRHVLEIAKNQGIDIVVVKIADTFKSYQGTDWVDDLTTNDYFTNEVGADNGLAKIKVFSDNTHPGSWKLNEHWNQLGGDFRARNTSIFIRYCGTEDDESPVYSKRSSGSDNMFSLVGNLATQMRTNARCKDFVTVAENPSTRRSYKNVIETMHAQDLTKDELMRDCHKMVRSSDAPCDYLGVTRNWSSIGFGRNGCGFAAETSKGTMVGQARSITGVIARPKKRTPTKLIWAQQFGGMSSLGVEGAPINAVHFRSSQRSAGFSFDTSTVLAMRPINALRPEQLCGLSDKQICYWVDPALRGDKLADRVHEVGNKLMKICANQKAPT